MVRGQIKETPILAVWCCNKIKSYDQIEVELLLDFTVTKQTVSSTRLLCSDTGTTP